MKLFKNIYKEIMEENHEWAFLIVLSLLNLMICFAIFCVTYLQWVEPKVDGVSLEFKQLEGNLTARVSENDSKINEFDKKIEYLHAMLDSMYKMRNDK